MSQSRKVVHGWKIFLPDVGVVFVKMLEVSLFHHRSFVDVEGDGDPIFMRDGGEFFTSSMLVRQMLVLKKTV